MEDENENTFVEFWTTQRNATTKKRYLRLLTDEMDILRSMIGKISHRHRSMRSLCLHYWCLGIINERQNKWDQNNFWRKRYSTKIFLAAKIFFLSVELCLFWKARNKRHTENSGNNKFYFQFFWCKNITYWELLKICHFWTGELENDSLRDHSNVALQMKKDKNH